MSIASVFWHRRPLWLLLWLPLEDLMKKQQGATAVEYALIAALAALGLAGGLSAIAELAALLFEMIGNAVSGADPGAGNGG